MRSPFEGMKFATVVSDIIQALEVELDQDKGTTDRDDLNGEAHVTFGGDASGSGGEDGGPSH